jgi:hypothetical protein
MKFQEIPKTWLIAGLIVSLTIMRAFGIDSFTTAGIGIIIGYLTGKHIEQAREPVLIPLVNAVKVK